MVGSYCRSQSPTLPATARADPACNASATSLGSLNIQSVGLREALLRKNPPMPLSHFSPLVASWFASKLGQPTLPQRCGWPAIAAGRHTLIAAPTGSGKTLAAFLFAIDQLLRRAATGVLPETTFVVYVSPLKALSSDVRKNLEEPLAELYLEAMRAGHLLPPLRVGLRTGDTPAAQRQQMVKLPPHILVTTPESLHLCLTALKSRANLAAVRTVIIDEVHALMADKRGAHLSLSLERLDALCRASGQPAPQRTDREQVEAPG